MLNTSLLLSNPPTPHTCADVALKELNASLLQEEEGLVSNRGLVTSYVGDPALNDSQAFFVWIPLELRRRYETTLLAQVEQVRWVGQVGQLGRV